MREYALEDYPNIYRVYIPAEDILGEDGIRTQHEGRRRAAPARGGHDAHRDHLHARARGSDRGDDHGGRHPLGDGAWGRGTGTRGSPGTTSRSTERPSTTTIPGSGPSTWRARRTSSAVGATRAAAGCARGSTTSACRRARTRCTWRRCSSPRRYDTGVMTHINRDREEIELQLLALRRTAARAPPPGRGARVPARGDPRDAHHGPRGPAPRRDGRRHRPRAGRVHRHRLRRHEGRDDAGVRRPGRASAATR